MIKSLLTGSALALVVSTAVAQDMPTSFTVGTASQGGTYFTYGSGWANLVAEEMGITGAGEITGGPAQNLANVQTGENEFGLTTMGPARDALDGNSPLAPGVAFDKVCAMFPMYETPFSITALSSSGIESIADIPDGARIGFGPAGSTSDTYFPAMLETLGVNFERRNGSWSDLGGQLQDGLLDLVAFAAGIPVPAVSQVDAQVDVNFIEFTEDEQAEVMDAYPVADFTIANGTYADQTADLRAVSMWNFAIANCDLPEEFVYQATKTVMENNDRMLEIHSASRTTVPENYERNTFIPWHPGAARWFEENGYDIADDMIYTAG